MTEAARFAAELQRLRALSRANEIRRARAELKRQIAVGAVSAADVVRESPAEAWGWSVAEMLRSQRQWGNVKCHRFLSRNQIGELKSVGDLSERQRRLLAVQLDLCASGHSG